MVASNIDTIRHRGALLDAAAADHLGRQAIGDCAKTVLLDLTEAARISTAALARLILLRRRLLRSGRDLRICGLRDQADALYQITRMERILPRQDRTGRTYTVRPATAAALRTN